MVYKGSTIRIRNTITDFNGSLIDPDTHEIKIYDSTSALQATLTTPTKEDIGKYYVDYTIPADALAGSWKVVWEIDKGGQKAVEVLRFAVEEA